MSLVQTIKRNVYEYRMLRRLRRLLREEPRPTDLHRQAFGRVSDEYWFWLNTEGIRTRPLLREALPGLPDEATQIKFIGSAGDHALREGFNFYQLCKQAYREHAGDFSGCGKVLDFGCGWGRMLRFYLKDLDSADLHGTDFLEEVVDVCKATNPWCRFGANAALPPLPYPDNTFGLVYCYSVFSHLAEESHLAWLAEFRRVLRPGGLVVATTWDREFIARCEALRTDPSLPCPPLHREAIAKLFLDNPKCLADYDAGRFCFAPYDREAHPWSYVGDRPVYGEACIPRGYVEANWSRHLDPVDFITDRNRCAQNVIVARKD
jgi:SAM-dependent methyltransferase